MVLTGKAATQERILEAAFELFVQQGYPRTTVQQVADGASVSRATVFWHFGGKAALFQGVLERLMRPIRESLEVSFPELSPSKVLEHRIDVTSRFVKEHQREVLALIQWAAEDAELRDHVRAEIVAVVSRFSKALSETVTAMAPSGRDAGLLGQGVELAFYGGLILSVLEPSEPAASRRDLAVLELVRVVQQLSE